MVAKHGGGITNGENPQFSGFFCKENTNIFGDQMIAKQWILQWGGLLQEIPVMKTQNSNSFQYN